jgi:type VI secretion system secreted protein VgrG
MGTLDPATVDTNADEIHFTWEGASHPRGPWQHLRVLELRAEEALSTPYAFEMELVHDNRGADIDVEAIVGARAAVKVVTRTDPTHRIVHGVITSAAQLELSDRADVSRYRLVVEPPIIRAAMICKSRIFHEKTLREIISAVLETAELGPALTASTTPRPMSATEQLESYAPPSLTYAWAIQNFGRIDDVKTRPYCVQYDESDWAFVARLLEEEGISYHFEQGEDEWSMVLTDFDGGRIDRTREPAFGPHLRGREIFDVRTGGRLRPASVHIDDYNWRNPKLDLRALSFSGATPFMTMMQPGRYEETGGHGKMLATLREERFDTERTFAEASSHCRLLAAGSVVVLEHPMEKFSGTYLVTRARHRAIQRHFVSGGDEAGEPYRLELEMIRCGKGADVEESWFRPERVTPRPRIVGTQTAVVTADPSDPSAEIHVGGPADIGCVRVRFRWDLEAERHEREPTSCWVRVSQFFAGADHGALWHPRVGNEVIVEFLDGDPDRPIVIGRVYNGTNLAPANATNRPTYSAIKSNTSPFDGNYNLIAFEDLKGAEEIIVHAARDWNSNVERNCSRDVGLDDNVHVKGDQSIIVEGNQTEVIDGTQNIVVTGARICTSETSITNQAPEIQNYARSTFGAHAGVHFQIDAGSLGVIKAPITRAEATFLLLVGSAVARLVGARVEIKGKSKIRAQAPKVTINGGHVEVSGGSVAVAGGPVAITGRPVTIESSGVVQVVGGVIHLN